MKYTHPSLVVVARSQDPSQKKRKSANNWVSPPPKKRIVYYSIVFFVSLQKHYDGSCFFFSFRISRGMAQTPVQVVEQFWCSYPLKGPSDVFLFLGQRSEFAKPRSTNPRKARDECILVWETKGFIVLSLSTTTQTQSLKTNRWGYP
jgi:hypothetical protein